MKEGFCFNDAAFGIELGFLIAEDFLSVDPMDNFFIATNLHFDAHPLIGGEVGGGGLDDVLGDELAIDLDIGSGGADVSGGARALAFIGEELEFDAGREALLEGHALWWLGVRHDAAVEILTLIHFSEPTRQAANSYAVFCLKKKKKKKYKKK